MPLWAVAIHLHFAIALFVTYRILRGRREPLAMVAWLFAVVFIPFLGALIYYLLGSSRLKRKASRRRRRIAHLISEFRRVAGERTLRPGEGQAPELPDDLARIEHLGVRLADVPATVGNEVYVLQEANETYGCLERAIRAAHHHVHMLYYIWQPDETGLHFRDLLIERAKEGIECRVLLDSVGSYRINRRFLNPMLRAGVKVAFFMPLHLYPLRRRWSLHLRNHRKLAVVDGQIGFTGSQNIGDEYRGRLRTLSPWYDTHIQVRGPAALFMQEAFAEDWFLATREALDGPAYFPKTAPAGDSVVQILPTGPYETFSVLAHLIFAAVSSAHSSIHITTPYFVPDLPMRLALMHACYRGVRVRLVLPTRSDAPIALWAARSFYPELLEAGVEIHEYERGMLHSKIVTVDDRWCMVGSANMDVRSFRLSFELTALLYDAHIARGLSASIDRFCDGARRITARDAHNLPFYRRMGEGAARLLAPLL